MGYRTICVHPYPAGFYGRDKIYPMMGFDEFIDIREFTIADRSGAYVGDVAVAVKIAGILEGSTGPVFVHTITMENHGPLHLEKVSPADVASLYNQPPPPGCNDLTIYLKHLRNADRMMSMLKDTMTKLNRPASLCWFGDHVPIMESVYDVLGLPDGQTEFLIWQTAHSTKSEVKNLDAHQLGANWLAGAGLMS
jgi:phosphoglycerol transferase MdoB-like AlkP superfamily enzyme